MIGRFTVSLVLPVLKRLDDGAWQNFLKHEDRESGSASEWFWACIGLGIALGHGWAEQNDTWARITPRGREALQVYSRSSGASAS